MLRFTAPHLFWVDTWSFYVSSLTLGGNWNCSDVHMQGHHTSVLHFATALGCLAVPAKSALEQQSVPS